MSPTISGKKHGPGRNIFRSRADEHAILFAYN